MDSALGVKDMVAPIATKGLNGAETAYWERCKVLRGYGISEIGDMNLSDEDILMIWGKICDSSDCGRCDFRGNCGPEFLSDKKNRAKVVAICKRYAKKHPSVCKSNENVIMNFAAGVLSDVIERARQEDSPIYRGEEETDYFVRLSDVVDAVNKGLLNLRTQ